MGPILLCHFFRVTLTLIMHSHFRVIVAAREELPRNLGGGNIEHLSHLSSQSSNKSFFFSDLRSSTNDGNSLRSGLVVRDVNGNWSTIEGNLPFDLNDTKTVTQTSWMGDELIFNSLDMETTTFNPQTYTDALEIKLHPYSDPLLVAKYASSKLNDQ